LEKSYLPNPGGKDKESGGGKVSCGCKKKTKRSHRSTYDNHGRIMGDEGREDSEICRNYAKKNHAERGKTPETLAEGG